MNAQEIISARQARRIAEAKEEAALGNKDIDELKKAVEELRKGMAKPLDCYPIGSIYITVSGQSPGELFGGTWVEYAQGRVLAGYKPNDADFNVVGKTGGAKTVVLTEGQIPKHKHPIRWYQGKYVSLSANGTGVSSSGYKTGYSSGTVYNNSMAADLQDSGGGAHQNLQPYITVRIWQRTA